MVKCLCGKTISTVPDWLNDVKVQFVCNNCPNREVQGITQVDLTGGRTEDEAPKGGLVDKMDAEAPDEDEEEEED